MLRVTGTLPQSEWWLVVRIFCRRRHAVLRAGLERPDHFFGWKTPGHRGFLLLTLPGLGGVQKSVFGRETHSWYGWPHICFVQMKERMVDFRLVIFDF